MPEGGLGIPQFSWEELFDNVGWFLTGYGDNVSLGITGLFRHSTGLGNVVPYHSASYKAGYMTATAVYAPGAVLGAHRLAKMGYKVGAGVWASAQAWRAGRTVQLAAQTLPKAAKLADDCGEALVTINRRNGLANQADLAANLGGAPKSFDTPFGYRHTDVYADGFINEAKTGYQTLTNEIRRQLEKDSWLLADPRSKVDGIVWHFYHSPITGRVGASQPLINELVKRGIPFVIH